MCQNPPSVVVGWLVELDDEITVHSQFVFGGSEVLVENEEEVAGLDVVEDMIGYFVVAGLYFAIGCDKGVNPVLYELKIQGVGADKPLFV